ncbi:MULTISPECIES: DUF417 family protein [Vibrio]|uniref:DUF417 family protein n=2 Tax=Vibrio TaxID=662 RepID=A0ABV4N552_9VIBR|nr:DUF417 family protein [Vibrio cyclitrophicus]OEF46057.1 hypothetical protein OAC_19105 [Vibrio cyclitrophicus 1F273]OEF66720.1 hypothetical protein OAA_08250 [Vibrio cyclitrophicus 1F175]PMH36246.1 hypothetical protein BCU72_08775 [Vibrio cyclitrophicus]PMI43922.1 hypothetical protein BCU44_19205 [Vibrio cyclitrophicus]PMJ19845.1 hypothetical protein BCU28_14425 [Vibrio cyclitrophicus]
MHVQTYDLKKSYWGYNLGVIGVALVLIWIGIYKFTPTEAMLIDPLIANHPALSWFYSLFSVQAVSNMVGGVEIIVAAGLIVGFINSRVAFYSGVAAAAIFAVTLSFLITTPNAHSALGPFSLSPKTQRK